jgi:hypothetical protein
MSQELKFFSAYDGCKYIDTFPSEWHSTQQSDVTGPLHCNNCSHYGIMVQNGLEIFLGYCKKCAIHVYEGKRGPGFFGFTNEQEVSSYEYPDYLENYKNAILKLSKHQIHDQIQALLEWHINYDDEFGESSDEFGESSDEFNDL